jgi:photosystem II stability/assembly factor-like uncharacterized protein
MRIAIVFALAFIAGPSGLARWVDQESPTRVRLRGLGVTGTRVAWSSGDRGVCMRTTDGGKTWIPRVVPDSSGLDFRDIHAFGDDAACLLSIGAGPLSRIYTTADGGATWTLAHRGDDPRNFLDAIAFWDPDHGLALGDPVDGRFVILSTDDGGRSWQRCPPEGMPPALTGEGAFAASGTCLVVRGPDQAWFGTGGARVARVFLSTDRGRTWTTADTPIRAGSPSSGIFSLACRDARGLVAVGGDYKAPDEARAVVALSHDGGRTWALPVGPQPRGYRSCVSVGPGDQATRLLSAGPNGCDLSTDGGEHWQPFGTAGFHAVAFADEESGWGVGEEGRIARFTLAAANAEAPGEERPVTISDGRPDADRILVHTVESPYQGASTEIRVLLPDVVEPGRRLPVVYALPVEAGDGARYGRGLLEVKKNDLHNRYDTIFVAPTFARLPWYADHPGDPSIRQESHFLDVVVPFVDSHYPAKAGRDGRLLLGFSKSGWGALSLLLRHPDRFARAAAWDAPLMETTPERYGMGEIFGTRENFEHYRLTRLFAEKGGELRDGSRLILLSYGNFRDQHVRAHERLLELGIPHVYRDGPKRAHAWGSGWVPEAVELLLKDD